VKKSLIVKVAAGLVALSVFGLLFMQSLQDARTAPYTVEPQHLRNWTLALEPASSATEPLLVLRPAAELAGALFRQVFARAMESLNAPVAPAIPIVLRGEFDRVVGDQLTQEALLAAARAAGLEAAAITPTCLVHRRISDPGITRQAYFLSFDAPAIGQFRQQLGLDASELSPILFVAGAGSDFNSWLPQRVSGDADCLAPVSISQ
jgi:hypothetical protein